MEIWVVTKENKTHHNYLCLSAVSLIIAFVLVENFLKQIHLDTALPVIKPQLGH